MRKNTKKIQFLLIFHKLSNYIYKNTHYDQKIVKIVSRTVSRISTWDPGISMFTLRVSVKYSIFNFFPFTDDYAANTVDLIHIVEEEKYVCYCGFYCECCVVKARIRPAAQNLLDEMKRGGFENFIEFIPGSSEFWPFLKNMAEKGLCASCKENGGDPDCAIRNCAREKGVDMCALCNDYPCKHFTPYEQYSILFADNEVLREKGMKDWSKIQDERVAKGFCYSDNNSQ